MDSLCVSGRAGFTMADFQEDSKTIISSDGKELPTFYWEKKEIFRPFGKGIKFPSPGGVAVAD